MSESFDLSQVPDDVKEMNRILGEFGDYHRLVMDAQFPGKACSVVDNLLNHLMDVYKQTHAQYMLHPWVIAKQVQKEVDAAAEAAELAKLQE